MFAQPKGFIYEKRCVPGYCRPYEKRDPEQDSASATECKRSDRALRRKPYGYLQAHKDTHRVWAYRYEAKGREHICEARLEKLNEVSEWVEQYRAMWENKLDALERYLDELQTKEEGKPKHKKHGKHK